jgi:hypothetical protein
MAGCRGTHAIKYIYINMLHGFIIYSGEPDNFISASLQSVRGVKWEAAPLSMEKIGAGGVQELLPHHCNMVAVLNPEYTTYAFLSELVRRGCHLFLTEMQKMTAEERTKLIHLSEEGNTLIQFRNDLLFHPSFVSGNNNRHETKLVVLQHVAPQKHYMLQEMLYCNLLMTLKIIDAEPSRINVCSIPSTGEQADIVNLHLNFNNGSAASLTFSFSGRQKEHLVSIHSAKGTISYNFEDQNHYPPSFIQQFEKNSIPENWLLFKQIIHFTESILKKGSQRNVLSEEAKTFMLIERINQKLVPGSVLI